nr:hypothetical protein CFP56_75873 [Quercus suber]
MESDSRAATGLVVSRTRVRFARGRSYHCRPFGNANLNQSSHSWKSLSRIAWGSRPIKFSETCSILSLLAMCHKKKAVNRSSSKGSHGSIETSCQKRLVHALANGIPALIWVLFKQRHKLQHEHYNNHESYRFISILTRRRSIHSCVAYRTAVPPNLNSISFGRLVTVNHARTRLIKSWLGRYDNDKLCTGGQ